MGKITLAAIVLMFASGIVAIGRFGGEIVADIAIGIFVLSVMLLGALLISYWFATHWRMPK